MERPGLTTDRLHLRPFRPADLDDLAALYGNPEVMRLSGRGRPRPRGATADQLDAMLAHWDRHGFGLWALHDRTDGRFVGRCGVAYLHDFPDAELAYTLARRYWGRGLATEAARAALAHALGALRLPRVVGVALVENLASQKVLLKAGMTLQGPYRYDGKDARLYGIDNPTPPP